MGAARVPSAGTSRLRAAPGAAGPGEGTALPAGGGACTGIRRELCPLGLCCSISPGQESSSCSPCTLGCWSRMSSVTRLRISSGLSSAAAFPFLLCTSLMKARSSELEARERQDQGWPWRALQAPCLIPAGSVTRMEPLSNHQIMEWLPGWESPECSSHPTLHGRDTSQGPTWN